jgi:DNA polymerase
VWLTDPEAEAANAPIPAAAAAMQPAPIAFEPLLKATVLPEALPELLAWWTSPANPFAAPTVPNLAPRGLAGAPILLLAPMPEAGDRETLLSGPQGKMLANMLRALGIEPDGAMLASALPSHQPLPAWDTLVRDGLGVAVQRLIEFAQPRRVILLGSKLPHLLGHDPAAPPESFSALGDIPVLTTFAPERLLDHPRQRARLWQRLLEWTKPA